MGAGATADGADGETQDGKYFVVWPAHCVLMAVKRFPFFLRSSYVRLVKLGVHQMMAQYGSIADK